MKKRNRQGRPHGGKHRRALRGQAWNEMREGFVKGFVSTGLLAALGGAGDTRRLLRAALQGGTALAAASVAAGAIGRRTPTTALGAIAVGALGLCLVDRLTGSEPSNSSAPSGSSESKPESGRPDAAPETY